MSEEPSDPNKLKIDPRINARRIEVLRSRGRRRLYVVTTLGILVALGMGLWGALQSPLLDLDHIRTEPINKSLPFAHLSPLDIEKASQLRKGDPLFSRDLKEVRTRVLAIPWVKDVEVSKEWPGTVRLKVSERSPIAAVRVRGGGWVLVDKQARLLQAIPDVVGVIPIEGFETTRKPGEVIDSKAKTSVGLVATFPETLLSQISRVVHQEDGSLLAFIGNAEGKEEVEVRFGNPADLSAKILDLTALLSNVGTENVAVFDVRVPGVPSVIRRR